MIQSQKHYEFSKQRLIEKENELIVINSDIENRQISFTVFKPVAYILTELLIKTYKKEIKSYERRHKIVKQAT